MTGDKKIQKTMKCFKLGILCFICLVWCSCAFKLKISRQPLSKASLNKVLTSRSPDFKRTEYSRLSATSANSPLISLGRKILPESDFKLSRLAFLLFCSVAALQLSKQYLPQLIRNEDLQEKLHVFLFWLQDIFDRIKSRISGYSMLNSLDMSEWNSLSVKENTPLSATITKLVLAPTTQDRQSIRTEVGREVMICFTDSENCVWQRPAYPLQVGNSRGELSLLVQTTEEASSVNRAVESLRVGSELAVRDGQSLVQASEKSVAAASPVVSRITVVASGLGIAPALQILQDVATSSTVQAVRLLWLNRDEADFVCEEELTALSKRLGSRLELFPFSDKKLFRGDLLQYPGFSEALSSPSVEEGASPAVVVVCGPLRDVETCNEAVFQAGYRTEGVVNIVCP